MTWVTWRQHRLEALWAGVMTALLSMCIAFVAYQMNVAACSGAGQSFCLANDAAGIVAQQIIRLDLFQYGLVVFPALAGAFIGAPLVARELESGTQRLAWTQGVTRARWLLVKLVLVVLPLLGAAALVGVLEIVLINVQNPQANRWAYFDQQAPLTVASTFIAMALGVALGAVIRRSVPAMGATLFSFVVLRIGLFALARPNYMTARELRIQDPSLVGTNLLPPTSWSLDQFHWVDSTGRDLTQRQIGLTGGSLQNIQAHGYYLVQHYQPGDRFWTFQAIESALLCCLALVVFGFAFYWVTRRST